jgi:hypothetical protein
VKLFAAFLLLLAADDFSSIRRKLDQIEQDRLPRGASVFMSLQELNAFARAQAQAIAPKAVHDVHLELGTGGATGSARIDFVELKKIGGGQSNWLLEKFLQGERPVKAIVRIQSRNGEARVDVDRVEVSGIVIQGAGLQFLIQNYVIPQFPDAKVEQWFPLAHHIDRVEVRPSGVTVIIGQ